LHNKSKLRLVVSLTYYYCYSLSLTLTDRSHEEVRNRKTLSVDSADKIMADCNATSCPLNSSSTQRRQRRLKQNSSLNQMFAQLVMHPDPTEKADNTSDNFTARPKPASPLALRRIKRRLFLCIAAANKEPEQDEGEVLTQEASKVTSRKLVALSPVKEHHPTTSFNSKLSSPSPSQTIMTLGPLVESSNCNVSLSRAA
jgi:hypothetical protein